MKHNIKTGMLLIFLLLIGIVCCSCGNKTCDSTKENSVFVDVNNSQQQEWLAYNPYAVSITNMMGNKFTVNKKATIKAIISNLKLMNLDTEIDNSEVPCGVGYNIALQYSNTKISYAF